MEDQDQTDRFNLKRKIFVGNISYRVTQKWLTKFFSKFGEVEYCYMVKDHIRKRPRGIAFITFKFAEDVEKAIQADEESLTLDGRVMRVLYAEESSRVKHVEGTIWDSKQEDVDIDKLTISDNAVKTCEERSSEDLNECHINKLCDDTLILILSMLPWKQRMAVERVCRRWHTVASHAWNKQESINFQSVFQRFDALTDTRLSSILTRCGTYLRKLDVSASPRLLTDLSIDVIAEHCPSLSHLDLSGMAVTDISLRTLGKKCNKLKEINLQRCNHITDKGLMWLFQNCTDIESLNIQGNPVVNGNCFQKIGDKCKILKLTDCTKLTDTGMAKICRHCTDLTELHISNCQLLTNQSLQKISQCLKKLAVLYLERTLQNVTQEGMLQITHLLGLRKVHLFYNLNVSDEFLSSLAINCPFLETLDISGCHKDVTGEGIRSLGFCSNLTSLDISYLYKVDDESIQVISRSGRLKSLVARACSNLTDDAFVDLPCLCSELEVFDVSGCYNITEQTVQSFIASRNLSQSKTLMMYIGGTSMTENEFRYSHPSITFCLQDLSQPYLRADRDIILPEPEPESDSDEDVSPSVTVPSTFTAAGAEAESDDDWDNYETHCSYHDDDLLHGDDPLEMERFEFS